MQAAESALQLTAAQQEVQQLQQLLETKDEQIADLKEALQVRGGGGGLWT